MELPFLATLLLACALIALRLRLTGAMYAVLCCWLLAPSLTAQRHMHPQCWLECLHPAPVHHLALPRRGQVVIAAIDAITVGAFGQVACAEGDTCRMRNAEEAWVRQVLIGSACTRVVPQGECPAAVQLECTKGQQPGS